MTRREILVAALALGALPQQKRPSRANSSSADPIFRDIASEVGLNFHHFNGATGKYFMPEIMGSGVALFDYDNDGDLDVYLVQGTTLDHRGKLLFPSPPGWKPGNRLFRNDLAETGKLHFTDVTDQAGVGHVGYGMGVAVGDYDNDGFQDLYVTNFGHNVLYHNNGDGTFTDVTEQAGVDDPRWSTCAAWLDYDGDGLLDLFVGNYVDFTVLGNKQCFTPTGEIDYCTPKAYQPVPSRLFKNLGNGKFQDVTESSGIGSSYGPALGVVCADFNGDGQPDIYVANDTAANRLWLNQGNGTFKESALEAGVAFSADGLPKAGMGVSAEDMENDDNEDILVTNLMGEGATLFRNNGKAEFDDVTTQYGLSGPTFGFTGFGTQFFDYDNDGWLDLFIANGAVTKVEAERGNPYPFAQKKQLFHNEGPAKRFRETSSSGGPAFQIAEVTRGAAFGDIDNDGAIDIVVTNNNGPARLLRNQVGAQQHWLQIKLAGDKTNRFGVGARVAVLRASQPPLWRWAHSDSSYLSASDIRVHFGLGKDPQLEGVVVHWPGGLREKWSNIRPDRIITLKQGSGKSE
ncbi:MAG TPA: CRTAC1 family protein [Terriglobia bacterium]|nr:CRTAC1 family protein [Terriglobia bacterium]